jgi:glycosyltransferase involved in cell wall biosynthesis
LAGNFSSTSLHDELVEYKGWEKVDELGFLNRDDIRQIFSFSLVGIVCFLPVPNHIDSQPNKLFEYMSAGLPVIASNFPLWKEIIEQNECGICVDPCRPEEIAGAIDYIVDNKKTVQEMGRDCRKAVEEKYNWAIEERKLIRIYQELS